MFAAFIFLPTRFWPRIDRELPFLAIALFNMHMVLYRRNSVSEYNDRVGIHYSNKTVVTFSDGVVHSNMMIRVNSCEVENVLKTESCNTACDTILV